jgi:hypothetical protein
MGSKGGTCAKCGKKIIGASHKIGDKIFCGDCYLSEMQFLREQEKAKVSFFEYLKNLFGRTSCPDPVRSAVDWALKNGKKLAGIRYTIYYYYEVLGNVPENISEVQWIIRDYYEEAKAYAEQMRRLSEHNKGVSVIKTPMQVKIKRPTSQKRLSKKMLTED